MRGRPSRRLPWLEQWPFKVPSSPRSQYRKGTGDLMPLLLLISARAPEGSSPGSPKSLGAFDTIPTSQTHRLESRWRVGWGKPGGQWKVVSLGAPRNWRYIPRERKTRIIWIIPGRAIRPQISQLQFYAKEKFLRIWAVPKWSGLSGEEGSGVWVKTGWLCARDAKEGILAVCKQLDQATACFPSISTFYPQTDNSSSSWFMPFQNFPISLTLWFLLTVDRQYT